MARLADRPFSPDRRLYASVGAAAGLAAGVLVSLAIRRRRSKGTAHRPVPVEA
jgi:hypothetical protein